MKKSYLYLWNALLLHFDTLENNKYNFEIIEYEFSKLNEILSVNLESTDIKNYLTNIAEYLFYSVNKNIPNIFDFDVMSDPYNVENVSLSFKCRGIQFTKSRLLF